MRKLTTYFFPTFFFFFALFWVNNMSAQDWTWMKGTDQLDADGVYGTMGVPDVLNTPGNRNGAVGFTDLDGNIWFFGGYGRDPIGYFGTWNDLWKYDIGTDEWTWVKGSDGVDDAGDYGQPGVPDDNNLPSARLRSGTWVDSDGNFWIFGGLSSGLRYSDLWRYEPATNQWTWMDGFDVAQLPGTYGTMGVADDNNNPGARNAPYTWVDGQGNFWMFGGFGYGEDNYYTGYLNDLWMYNPGTGQWTWMGGSTDLNANPTYGDVGVPNTTNNPGARVSGGSWVGDDGQLYLFAGQLNFFRYNDIWSYNTTNGEWTWVKGNNITNAPGVIENIGMTGPNDTPGARNGCEVMTDVEGRVWMFGGYSFGLDPNDAGFVNDLWMYDPGTNNWTFIKGSPNSGGDGVYGTMGVPSPSNVPAPAASPTMWRDGTGEIWMLGGNANNNRFNALWRLNGGDIPSDVAEVISISGLRLFPNPTTSEINLTFTEEVVALSEMNIQVQDYMGRTIYSITTSKPVIQVDGLAGGIYLLTVEVNDKIYVARFIKE